MEDDSDLAGRFAGGSEDAFEAVFTAFRGPVFGIALHVLADPGLAEEAAQLAFLGLWRSRQRYDPKRPLAAWVFGITRKAAIDIYRRERRHPPSSAIETEPAVEALSVERMWEAWEVRRALDALPRDEADVMRLAHYYQMTHSEIANHLGIPVGTVKSRSFRAHRHLAEALSHLLDGNGPDTETVEQTATVTGTDADVRDEVTAGGG
jgi:RNA polymerase sigma factor (sigma-70 family)